MDFNFSEDQQQLRDAVRRWVSKGYTFERRREIVAQGGFSRAAYAELAELGLTALAVPEAHGGLGQGPIDVMVAMEELGRGIVLEPLAQTLITSGVLGGYAPADGRLLWKVTYGEGFSVIPRPIAAEGIAYVATGYGVPKLLAIRLGNAAGDVTKTHLAWEATRRI